MSEEVEKLPPYIDDLTVRETYGELVQTTFGEGGTLRIELCVIRWTAEGELRKRNIVPVARLVIPYGLAQVLRNQINERLELVEKQTQLAQAHPPSQSKN